eukprot:c224_g1_i1.p1 GENE.c224_g1_i1~~c224_g1_i1.p1  ORF type:complete len:202 (-),score=27.90 c224_g1_i1:12-617(-)
MTTISLRCLELMNEEFRDLLSQADPSTKIQIVKKKDTGFSVVGCDFKPCLSEAEAIELLRTAVSSKSQGYSICSHFIAMIRVTKRNPAGDVLQESDLTFVDLAGSERSSRSSRESPKVERAQFVVRALVTLGEVLSVRARGGPPPPIRNSRLTHLLGNSLCGEESRIALILNVGPDARDEVESISTLRFGQRCQPGTNQLK